MRPGGSKRGWKAVRNGYPPGLVEEINAGDLIEDFKQGAQQLRRETPALKSYNTTIKSFTSLSKSLLDLLPEKTQKQAGEELMNFATKPAGAGKR